MLAMVVWFLGLLATPFTTEVWQFYLVRFITGMGELGRLDPLLMFLG